MVKELQRDLARKYHLHGPRIEQIWRSFGKEQREKALKAGAANGEVLKTRTDQSMGDIYKFIPELNLRDVAQPDSDFLLDHLRHRACRSVFEQYKEGPNGGLGDERFIAESMRNTGLRHVRTQSLRYCFTLFFDENQYGESYCVSDPGKYREVMNGLSAAVRAGLCVPQATGELIMERQLYLLQALNILVEDILDIGSTTRAKDTNKKKKKPEEVANAALSALSIGPKQEKLSIQDLASRAADQKASQEDSVILCRTEPVYLRHLVNIWFFSRPELVQDAKGRRLPMTTDKYISSSFLQAVHNVVTRSAVWGSIHGLIQELSEAQNDRPYQATLLQELSNVCHFEYTRVRALLKRYAQVGSCSKYFARVPDVFDNGVARVAMKTKPERLTRIDPQTHYILRLCQAETDIPRAADWIKKLDEFHRFEPMEHERMLEGEFDAYGDLAVIVGFCQSLSSSTLPVPPVNSKKGQTFVRKLKALEAEIDSFKDEIDLTCFAIPIDNLLEPGVSANALRVLDQFIIDKCGADIGFLYQDVIEDCLADIQTSVQRFKEKERTTTNLNINTEQIQIQEHQEQDQQQTPNLRIEQRKQKTKTRPPHSSVYSITPTTTTTAATNTNPDNADINQAHTVKPTTYNVMTTLFSQPRSQGSIRWDTFVEAMADLKFAILPRFGSVYTFAPAEEAVLEEGRRRSVTMHRPHRSKIEGFRLLYFARRLRRAFGWGEGSFQVA